MSKEAAGRLDRLWAGTVSLVAVDVRALAALRIAVALLLLADLALRARDLDAHYTDAGALPRVALAEGYPVFARLSVHALSGARWFEAALFLLAGVLATALLVGYRSRSAAAASLVLLVSLHARNPLVLNAGDALLRRLLLWGLFLPLGARWSLDARRRVATDVSELDGRGGGAGGEVASLASAALLLQVVLVYATNAVYKLRGELWRSGEAIRYVFGVDHLTVLFGDVLARFPTLLVAADRLWLALVLASPLLLLLRGRARSALVAPFVAGHLGMALTLRLGLFPLVSIVALLPFLHRGVWDAFERRCRATIGGGIDRVARRLDSTLPRWPGGPSAPQGATPAAVAVLLVLVLGWNAAALGLVGLPADMTSTVDPAEHRWDMFAPDPRTDDGWYVSAGRLASGDRVDAFRGGTLSTERPPELASTFPSHRWFVYLIDLRRPSNAPLRDDFADYLCRRWNARHDAALTSVTVTFVVEPVRLEGPAPRRRVELARAACSEA